jgi:uncharacterized membrane protein YphA (DoxX/SURF4 family)
MGMNLLERLVMSRGGASMMLIRVLVGAVFLSEGIQKFLFSASLGVGRFVKIGIPHPGFTAPFVGVVEIVCGAMIVAGLLTRVAAIPLLINISVAIATTKVPMLLHQGFWPMAHEARVDFCMFLGLVFLAIEGAGRWSFDQRIGQPNQRGTPRQ